MWFAHEKSRPVRGGLAELSVVLAENALDDRRGLRHAQGMTEEQFKALRSELSHIRIAVYVLVGASFGLAVRHYGLWQFLFGAWL
jgi:hypothetical protein